MLNKLAVKSQRLSPGLRKIISNTGWLFADRILRLGVGLFVSVWVARYLGPEQYGLYNYTTAFVSLFLPLSTLGINNIVIRDLVKNSSEKNEILGTAFILQTIFGITSASLTILVSSFLPSVNTYTNLLIAIASFTLVLQSFTTIDCWFQSKVESLYVVLSRNLAFLATTGLKIVLLTCQAPLIMFICLIALESILYSLALAFYYQRNKQHIKDWKFKLDKATYLLKESWPLLLTGIAVSLYLKIDQVMLGQLADTKDVGVYAVAASWSEIWYMVPGVLSTSLYPAIIRSKDLDKDTYQKRLQRLYDLMALIAYCVVLSVLPFSETLILLVYGNEYRLAAPILSIYLWTCVFAFQGIAQSRWIVTEGLQKLNFYSTLSGAVLNIILNLILIPYFKGIGAAIATLVSYAVASYFSFLVFPQTRENAQLMTKALFIPFRIPRYLAERKSL